MEATLQLEQAEMTDFTYWDMGEKKRKVGMPYYLQNSKGELECYEIGEHTNAQELAQFIKEGRCWLHKKRGKLN